MDKLDGEDYSDVDEDDVRALQKNIDPDFLAAAHKMGYDMSNDQMQELQKMIMQEQYNGDSQPDQEDEHQDDGAQQSDQSQMESKESKQSYQESDQK